MLRDSLHIIKDRYNAQGKTNLIGVEIGVMFGDHAQSIIDFFPEVLKLYLVEQDEGFYNHIKSRFEKYGARVECILGKSHNIAEKFGDGYFDFVYIDAAHGYNDVSDDITMWLPKVKSGGYISGHDFGTKDEGVAQAVKEKFGNNYETNGDWWSVK